MAYAYHRQTKKHGWVWYIGWTDEFGRARQKRTRIEADESGKLNQRKAEKLAYEREAEAEDRRSGRAPAAVPPVLFADAAELYDAVLKRHPRSYKSSASRWKRLKKHFGKNFLSEINSDDIEAYTTLLTDEG